MTPEEFEALRAPLRAAAERAQTPAAQYRHRLAMAAMEGRETPKPPPADPEPPRELTEREQRLADGLIFSVRDDDQAAAQAEHRARRRRAEAAVRERERLHSRLRDLDGADAADAWFDGGDAA